MDAEEIQIQVQGRGNCNKFPRIGNGRKIGPVDEEEVDGGENRLRGWHGSSRIIRVSRASGGKDRHSKVWTSKGLRDRRVRLSVTTAIQFYDLQDRLGYDQPSKAVEWLIKAAADSISELPALTGSSFPETQMDLDQAQINNNHNNDQNNNQNNDQNNQISMSNKSSSTSETSKGSGLSLSRSEVRVNRVKASRERARERAAKNPVPQNSSFTELLTAGASAASAPMDYFSSSGLLGQSSSPVSKMQAFHHHHHHQLGNSIPGSPYSHHQHQEMQQFSFAPDHYNLNFTISPSGGSYSSRGTLQSNSPSFSPHHHFQRFAQPVDGSNNVPFFLAPGENNHHHQHLQQQQQHIFYGDSKEKGKN